MDIHDIRLANLRLLAPRAGGRPKLAQRLGMSYQLLQNYIGKTPTKRIGEKTARKVEATFALPHGWMDHLQEGPTAEKTLNLIEERENIIERAGDLVEEVLQDDRPELDIWEKKTPVWTIDSAGAPETYRAERPPYKFQGLERLTIDLLPDHLRKNASKQIRAAGFQAEVDYMSDKLVVELKSANRSSSVDSGLLQLATIRSMLPPDPPRIFALILLEEQRAGPRLQQAMIRGGLLGVNVYIAGGPEDAALIIEGLEKNPPARSDREVS